MRIARYRHGSSIHLGVLVDDEHVAPFASGIADLQAYLALSPGGRASLGMGKPEPLAEVQLLAPVVPQKNVICVGKNYADHAAEIAKAGGVAVEEADVPTFFTKPPTSIAGPGATLHLSRKVSQQYDWEAELAVVIGKRCCDVADADALDVVFGYTCLNDLTARDLQKRHKQWFKGKSLDDTCPIGPWIVTADEIPDPQSLAIQLRVDGVEKQSSNTRKMIFDVRQIIGSLTAGLTLEPGDVIATGTPDGVGIGRTPPEFLEHDMTVEVEIEKIGILRNRIEFKTDSMT